MKTVKEAIKEVNGNSYVVSSANGNGILMLNGKVGNKNNKENEILNLNVKKVSTTPGVINDVITIWADDK